MKADQNHQNLSLNEYKSIFKSTQLPLKLKLYFSQLQDLFQKSSISRTSKYKGIDELFANKFLKLSQKQKQEMMKNLITAVIQEIKGFSQLQNRGKLTADNEIGKGNSKQNISTVDRIQTSCKLQSSNWGLTVWLQVKFKLQNSRRIITVANKKKNITILLQNYIVRQSKKRKQTLVFQSISSKVSQQYSKISLYFDQSVYPVIYQQIFRTIIQINKEALLKMVGDQQAWSERSPQLSDRLPTQDGGFTQNDKNLVFLTPQQVGRYLKWRSETLKKLKNDSLGFRLYEYKAQEKITLFKSNKKQTFYLLEYGLQNSNIQQIRKELLNGYKNRCKYRTGRNIVQEYSKRFKAIYDRYLIGNKIYQQINIEEEFGSNQDVIFIKGIQNLMTQNLIQFLYIKLAKKQSSNLIVSVFVNFTTSKQLKQETITCFLIQLRDMLLRSQQEQTVLQIKKQAQQQQVFYTIIGNNNHQNDISIELELPKNPILPEQIVDLKKVKSMSIINFLTNKHNLSPIILTQQELKNMILKQHYLFKQWSRCKNGGVVCTNQTMLLQQKKMIKSIIANIGANIYKIVKTGGLLTMSLPVTIFKKESHLQTIANNFTFAPLLLDNLEKDPLNRLKKAVIFTISVSNLGVSSQKPFNPVLGQTLQCWIAGCPLYLEQITHQPPNSAFLFEGRGYRISGQIESKVGIAGLNTAKCWSERPNLIEFQDGTKIALIFSRMLIKGILMGDREFHFEDKVYVYDMTNHYFAQINFGPRKKSKADPQDFLHGKIFRTTTRYLNKFKSKNPSIFPSKDDIAKDICEIEGIWNQGIYFDGKQQFNFITTMPYILEMEEHPLPSNSSFRKDLQYYITGNTSLAQQHKQVMQQQQRRDRKLREQYGE